VVGPHGSTHSARGVTAAQIPSWTEPVGDAEIAALFTAPVCAVVATPAMYGAALPPCEQALISRAVDKRRREFTAGRSAAHEALTRLGTPTPVILHAHDRAPAWPDGVVGSITHCDGFCCAVAARCGEVEALGVDVESATPLERDLAMRICSPAELDHFSALEPNGVDWPKLAFSAKEAFYKCYSPLARTFLEFHDVAIAFWPDGGGSNGAFRVRLVRPGRPRGDIAVRCEGLWRLAAGRFHTGVTLRGSGSSPS
jgi:4'-phosphopantetheinyl transferase EntD